MAGPVEVSGPPGFPAITVKRLPRRSMRMRTGGAHVQVAACLDRVRGRRRRGSPPLQGDLAIAMQRHIGVGGVRLQALPDDERRFALELGAGAGEFHVGGKAIFPDIFFHTN